MPVPTLRRAPALAIALLLLLSAQAGATTLLQMNLKDLADRSDKVFRGTVLSVKTGTVEAGGGELPIVIYRLRVEETFKGTFPGDKHAGLVEIRMIGLAKTAVHGNQQRMGLLADMPRLETGQSYVLFTTRPSAVGLSTTVGLGQGAFRLLGGGKQEQAVNAFNNVGLNRGLRTLQVPSRGPMSYGQFADAIRSVVGK